MENQIVWVDIPTIDIERAERFYSSVLNIGLKKDWPGKEVYAFSHEGGAVSACLFFHIDYKPSGHGPMVYLNVSGRLDDAIKKATTHGGKIIKDKHSIEPYGFRAIILDSEGNRVALHSMR